MINLNPLVYKQNNRVTQRDIVPHAVKGRSLSSTAIIVASQSTFSPTTFGNGQAARFTSTTTQAEEDPILLEKYWSAYVGSVSASTNIFSNTYDSSGLIIRGPVYDEMRWDGTKYTTTATLVIQNVSAGSITVYVYVREKLLIVAPSVSNT